MYKSNIKIYLTYVEIFTELALTFCQSLIVYSELLPVFTTTEINTLCVCYVYNTNSCIIRVSSTDSQIVSRYHTLMLRHTMMEVAASFYWPRMPSSTDWILNPTAHFSIYTDQKAAHRIRGFGRSCWIQYSVSRWMLSWERRPRLPP